MTFTPTPEALLSAAQAFHDDDPDRQTRSELSALIAARDLVELADRFSARLEFGTAGLRGVIGAGTNRMNRRVVAETTAGLCAYLARAVPDAKRRGICVAYDGRRMSRAFADETIAVATGAGFVVHAFDDVAPTPLLSFSVLDRSAAAGVMVTASHNPREYNGYKVYFDNGAQIIPPHDTGIAEAIARVTAVCALPRLDRASATQQRLVRDMDGVRDRYLAATGALIGKEPPGTPLRIAYTALHGVGEELARATLAGAGFNDVLSVAAQAQPDGEFPTVSFPNPEEKGAMDMVLALAEKSGAELVIANDPDADRLALASRAADGKHVLHSGNEVGLLLADHLLDQAPRDGKNVVLSSIVSSPLIEKIAKAHGAHWEPTLTGFKWIANRAIELAQTRGLRFVFGFEEALGYTVGTLVRDKDGISAAALAARVACHHKRAGRTLFEALTELYRKHGLFESRQVSLTLPGSEGLRKMAAVMDALRANSPRHIGAHEVRSVLDLELGVERRGVTTKPATLPKSNVIFFELEGGHRIAIRPSGTEPKIKIYLDIYETLASGETLGTARARAALLEGKLRAAFLTQSGLG